MNPQASVVIPCAFHLTIKSPHGTQSKAFEKSIKKGHKPEKIFESNALFP